MTDVPARELRNHLDAVLRRMEHGERLQVTVSGRPVAQLLPLPSRPSSMAWPALFGEADRWRADPALAKELAELLPATTDDVAIP